MRQHHSRHIASLLLADSYKGTVLSIFFLGYAATQLLGGSLADVYGGKAVLATGVVAWSSFTILTPNAAVAGSATLITCRVAMGLGEVRTPLTARHALSRFASWP